MTRKTQLGWMALGGLLCLCGAGLAYKMRGGRPAVAPEPTLALAGADTPRDEGPELPPVNDPQVKPAAFTSSLPPLPPDPPPAPMPSAKMDEKTELPPAPPPPPSEVPPPAVVIPVSPSVPAPVAEDKGPPPPPAPVTPPPTPEPPAPPTPVAPPAPVPPPSTPPLEPAPLRDLNNAPKPPAPPGETLPPIAAKPEEVPPAPPPAPPESPSWTSPRVKVSPPPPAQARPIPVTPEPPPANGPGPFQVYQVRYDTETMHDIARRTMGSADRWKEVAQLNPTIKPEGTLNAGTQVRLPADACLNPDEGVKPLPNLKSKTAKAKVVLPLSGTHPCNLDGKRGLTLPQSIRDQFGDCETLMVSPGPDQCLWVTNQTHLDRMTERLEQLPAKETDVRTFRRLYFAQVERVTLDGEGRISVPEKLAGFADLHQEVVLVGIDDHFELWDAARWRQYTQQKSSARQD